MAEFHEIGSSQFTDVTPTGEEKFRYRLVRGLHCRI